MVSISGTTIRLTRGDTAAFGLSIMAHGEDFTLGEGDRAIFSVKASFDDEEYAVQKDVEDGIVRILHEDTMDLNVGNYVWDIQIMFADGQVTTIGPGRLKLLADVTRE